MVQVHLVSKALSDTEGQYYYIQYASNSQGTKKQSVGKFSYRSIKLCQHMSTLTRKIENSMSPLNTATAVFQVPVI